MVWLHRLSELLLVACLVSSSLANLDTSVRRGGQERSSFNDRQRRQFTHDKALRGQSHDANPDGLDLGAVGQVTLSSSLTSTEDKQSLSGQDSENDKTTGRHPSATTKNADDKSPKVKDASSGKFDDTSDNVVHPGDSRGPAGSNSKNHILPGPKTQAAPGTREPQQLPSGKDRGSSSDHPTPRGPSSQQPTKGAQGHSTGGPSVSGRPFNKVNGSK